MSPRFLGLDEVLTIHRDQVARYGGTLGLRDLGLLESALAMPGAGFGGQYLHEDLFAMAAAYLYHLVPNHPFVDGNQRSGAVAAIVFLALNGIELDADEESFEATVRAVAEGKLGRAAVAAFFRQHADRPGRPGPAP